MISFFFFRPFCFIPPRFLYVGCKKKKTTELILNTEKRRLVDYVSHFFPSALLLSSPLERPERSRKQPPRKKGEKLMNVFLKYFFQQQAQSAPQQSPQNSLPPSQHPKQHASIPAAPPSSHKDASQA